MFFLFYENTDEPSTEDNEAIEKKKSISMCRQEILKLSGGMVSELQKLDQQREY